MGQYWKLYNLDKHERCDIHSGLKLGEFFFADDPACDLQALLTRLAESVFLVNYIETEILPGFRPTEIQVKYGPSESNKSLILEKLPNEILDIICGRIDGLDNITVFALTCPRFWEVGRSHIIRIRDGLIAEKIWAGSRIICGGDYQDSDDWPSSIAKGEYETYLSKNGWPDRSNSLRFLQFQDNYYTSRSFEMTKSERKAWGYICEQYCDGTSFVLRNLSKKLYVSENGFDKLFEGCDEKRPKSITLGHVAIAQICWSSDPSTSMSYEGPIHRGQWAGDKLEIVSINRHTSEIEEAKKENQEGSTETAEQVSHATGASECGWKDVTEECMKLIEDIWVADYGDDWKENVVPRQPPSPLWGSFYSG